MKNADIAMYQAKEDGKNNFQFYSAQMKTNSFERLALESSLHRTLDHGEFQLHYQPKMDPCSGEVVGIEALLRWQYPELGMVAPTKLIPIAEETWRIVSIGQWSSRQLARKTWPGSKGIASPEHGCKSVQAAVFRTKACYVT